MSRDDVDIAVRLRNAKKAAADAQRVSIGLGGIGRSAKQSEREVGGLGRAVKGVGRLSLAGAAGAGTALAGGLYVAARAGREFVGNAVDQGEQVSKNKQVFKDGANEVLSFSQDTSTAFGISRAAALEATGTFGNMLVPMGLARKRAAGMSTKLVALAADMASFNNASPEDTLEALSSGLAGETEPLRKYGVFLNQARIEQEASNLGLKHGKKALTAAAKAQATYSIILKDTKDTQGDYGRTSASLANRQRTLAAQWENLGASIGKGAIPELQTAAGAASDFLAATQKIVDRKDLDLAGKAGLVRGAFTREMGPIVQEIGGALDEANLGERLGDAVEEAAPHIADALAAQAPHAATAFVSAFAKAGPGGQLLTVALLAGKLGAFSGVARSMAGRFAETFTSQLPASMDARKGRMESGVRTRGSALGGVMGKAFGIAVAFEIADSIAKSTPALDQYSGEKGYRELYNDTVHARGLEGTLRDKLQAKLPAGATNPLDRSPTGASPSPTGAAGPTGAPMRTPGAPAGPQGPPRRLQVVTTSTTKHPIVLDGRVVGEAVSLHRNRIAERSGH